MYTFTQKSEPVRILLRQSREECAILELQSASGDKACQQLSRALFIITILFILTGCQNERYNLRMPVISGMLLEIKPSPAKTFDSNPDKLQIYWFGTTCYYIQLGKVGILTDPFVTSGLENLKNAHSDTREVERTLGQIKQPPDAIFISHSHSDHLLDAHTAMLQIPSWQPVPLFGSRSTKNILMGFGNPALNRRLNIVDDQTPGKWIKIELSKEKSEEGYSIEYMALESTHSPHLNYTSEIVPGWSFSKVLLDGKTTEPLTSLPKFWDYKTGEVHSYLFRLRYDKEDDKVSFVALLISPMPLLKYPNGLPPNNDPVDVLLGTAALPNEADSYPKEHIEWLKPRVVILSHFNNFFEKERDEIIHVGGEPKTDIKQYLIDVQSAARYPEFERVLVPPITEFNGDSIKNLIVITKGR